MELRESVKRYFVDGPYNCAEGTLLAARDVLNIPIDDSVVRALGSFGGGMGCGELCGAIAGACAAVGCALIQTNAHGTPDAKEAASKLTNLFLNKYGTLRCEELRTKCFDPDLRCGKLVDEAVDYLDAVLFEKTDSKA